MELQRLTSSHGTFNRASFRTSDTAGSISQLGRTAERACASLHLVVPLTAWGGDRRGISSHTLFSVSHRSLVSAGQKARKSGTKITTKRLQEQDHRYILPAQAEVKTISQWSLILGCFTGEQCGEIPVRWGRLGLVLWAPPQTGTVLHRLNLSRLLDFDSTVLKMESKKWNKKGVVHALK